MVVKFEEINSKYKKKFEKVPYLIKFQIHIQ